MTRPAPAIAQRLPRPCRRRGSDVKCWLKLRCYWWSAVDEAIDALVYFYLKHKGAFPPDEQE